MSRAVKIFLAVPGGLVLVIAQAFAGLAIYANARFHRQVDRQVVEITADTTTEGVARGEYLVTTVMACVDCHTPEGGPLLSGKSEPINTGLINGVFAPPNLTSDVETGLGGWSDGEIARAIREGINREGQALVIMPSFNFYKLSDEDVADVIGYLSSLPPTKNETFGMRGNLVTKIMMAL